MNTSDKTSVVEEILSMFEQRGGDAYFGEPVSQLEHALQAAHLAEQERAPDSLVVAALLHDIGHLVHGLEEDIAEEGIDGRHEAMGRAWLARWFDTEVTEPVRLHVDAKRYLCAVEPAYLSDLSPASLKSLALQGGPMQAAEITQFESHRFYGEAVRLRRWDDQAKRVDLPVPGILTYRERLEKSVR